MYLSLILILLLSFSITALEIKWNTNQTERIASPPVRRFLKSWQCRVKYNQYHHKVHFGLIIKGGTRFQIQVNASSKIEKLFFYCLAEVPIGASNMIDLSNTFNLTRNGTANFDCVPMTSVTYNVPVEIKIITSNWTTLPVFDTSQFTFLSSKQGEADFYHQVELYGFAENHYTQMLLTKEDIQGLQSAKYSLYLGLRNQADLVQYYDYLQGASRYNQNVISNRNTIGNLKESNDQKESSDKKKSNDQKESKNQTGTNDLKGSNNQKASNNQKNNQNATPIQKDITEKQNYYILDRKSFFLRTEPCHQDVFKNGKTFVCDNDESCKYKRPKCNYLGIFQEHSISVRWDIKEFLKPLKGSSWLLLHEVGHGYNIETTNLGFGKTTEVWNNIFATMYQFKHDHNNYWINNSLSDNRKTVEKYRKGLPIETWSPKEKLHFFMSLFGYDGTDATFREFHIRHYAPDTRNIRISNIVPTLLEVMFDLHGVNVLPFFKKVIDFETYGLVSPDLEMKLMSLDAVMPGIEFKIEAKDLPRRSRERDLRFSTPLFLVQKPGKKSLLVNFDILGPEILLHECLYLNNVCYNISNTTMSLQLDAGVYSVYVASEIGDTVYLSDVTFHTIQNPHNISIAIKSLKKPYLPLIYYSIDAVGISDQPFAKIFINYGNMTISISQFRGDVHPRYASEIYYSVELTRKSVTLLKNTFYGKGKVTKDGCNFEFGDELRIFRREPKKKHAINGETGCFGKNLEHVFVLTDVGLRHKDNDGLEFIVKDVDRIRKLNDNSKILLSYNPLFRLFIRQYAHALMANDLGQLVPEEWKNF